MDAKPRKTRRSEAGGKPIPRPRRRWWQILIRIAVAVLLLLLVGYISLPWWAPKDLIRRYIAESLTEQMGVAVEVGPLSISWSDGVEIDGLSIASPAEFAPDSMLRAERIRCDFSPLYLLLRHRLEWMELDQVRLAVQMDQEGRLNIAPLKKIKIEVEANRLAMRRSEVTMQLPGDDPPLVLQVSDLQFLVGNPEKLGQITMTAGLVQNGGVAPVSMRISGGVDEDQAAEAYLHFTHLDLSQLPLSQALLKDIPLRSLRGRCSGHLVFGVNANLKVDQLYLELLARKLQVHTAGAAELPVIDEAGLRVSAAIDAFSERVDMRSLHIRLPGIDLSGTASVYSDILQGRWDALEMFNLQGAVYPRRLVALLSGRETLPNDLTVTGPLKVKLSATRNGKALDVGLNLQADQTEIRQHAKLLKPAGRNMTFELKGTLREMRDIWPLELEQARATLGNNTVTGTGTISDVEGLLDTARPNTNNHQTHLRAALKVLDYLRLRGTMKIEDPDSLRMLASGPEPERLQLDGTLSGPWSIEGGGRTRFSASLRADGQSELIIGEAIRKPAGRELTLDIAATVDPDEMRFEEVMVDLTTEGGRVNIDSTEVLLGSAKMQGRVEVAGKWEAAGIEAFAPCAPSLRDFFAAIAGGGDGAFTASFDAGNSAVKLNANLDPLTVNVQPYFLKTADEAMRAEFEILHEKAESRLVISGDVKTPQAKLSGVFEHHPADGGMSNLTARTDIEDVAWAQEHSPLLSESLRGGQVSGKLHIFTQITRDGNETDFEFGAVSPELDCVIGQDVRLNFTGQIAAKGNVIMSEEEISLKVGVDAQNLSLKDFAGFTKPPDIPASFALDVTAPRDLTAIDVRDLSGQVGDVQFAAEGKARVRLGQNGFPKSIAPDEAHTKVFTTDASTIGLLFPRLAQYAPSGAASADVRWSAKTDGTDEKDIGTITTASIEARNFQLDYRGKKCVLDGDVLLENIEISGGKLQRIGRFGTDGLQFHAGRNHGWLLADIRPSPNTSDGTFHVLLEYLDDKDIIDWLSEGGEEPVGELSEKEVSRLFERADKFIEQIKNRFLSAELRGRISADKFRTYDAKVGKHYLLNKLEVALGVEGGRVEIEYDAGLNGGGVRAQIAAAIKDDHPQVTSEKDFLDVLSTPNIQPKISLEFPGNTVSGLFSRTEKVQYSLRRMIANAMDARCHLRPIGRAKMTATNGVLIGPAAPKFVTNIFPDLNLTRYKYDKMTTFTEFLPDGSAENETFFYGGSDVYMEGVTKADNTVQYSLGLVLMGSSFPPEDLRNWRQGRVPILKIKGRIEGGKLLDEEVSYPLPNETLFDIFLRNSLVYRTWINLQKKPLPPPAAP